MKVKNNQTKFYASPFIMIGLIIMIILSISFWLFTLYYPFVEGRIIDNIDVIVSEKAILLIISIFGAGIFPFIGFILTCHKGFTLYQLTNDGIRTSLFRIFKRKELMWDEVFEIRHIIFLNHWIFISDVSLEGMNYQQIIKLKNVIQIESNKKLIDSIRQYSDKQIINLPNQQ